MKTTTTAVVRMARGNDWVNFSTTESEPVVTMKNSKGETHWGLTVTDAMARVATLAAQGWTAATATG